MVRNKNIHSLCTRLREFQPFTAQTHFPFCNHDNTFIICIALNKIAIIKMPKHANILSGKRVMHIAVPTFHNPTPYTCWQHKQLPAFQLCPKDHSVNRRQSTLPHIRVCGNQQLTVLSNSEP